MPYGLRRGSSEERDSHFIIDGSWYAHEVLGDQKEASETDDDGFGTTPTPPPFEQNNDSADKIIVTDRSWFAHEALGDRKEEAAPEETEDNGGFGSSSSTFSFPKPSSFEKNSDGDKIIVTEGGPGGPGPGWDWDADPDNPYNWPAGKRWAQVAMAASFSCLA